MESRKVFFVAQVLTIFQDMNVLPNDWDVAAKKTFYIVYLPLCCVVLCRGTTQNKWWLPSKWIDNPDKQRKNRKQSSWDQSCFLWGKLLDIQPLVSQALLVAGVGDLKFTKPLQ